MKRGTSEGTTANLADPRFQVIKSGRRPVAALSVLLEEARENEGGNRCRVYLYAVTVRASYSCSRISFGTRLLHHTRDGTMSSSLPIFQPDPPTRSITWPRRS